MSNSVYINFVYVWRQIEKKFQNEKPSTLNTELSEDMFRERDLGFFRHLSRDVSFVFSL